MTQIASRKTEIICICSGKGGVGKTLFASCLGYALTRAGLRVLMIDGDLATDGLSLFLLGPKGTEQVESFSPSNTFVGALASYRPSPANSGTETGQVDYEVRKIYRNGPDDHGVIYDALISGRSLYGDTPALSSSSPTANGNPESFMAASQALFDAIRRSGEYDYVIIDTRGGFSYESTGLCALADSFLVVIEADLTSFYQTRNLVRRINEAAGTLETKSLLRGFLVNKAVDGMPASGDLDLSKVEVAFRNALTREFPVKFSDTHPIPADLEVLLSYKVQMVPFLKAPASFFTYATLTAYSDIFQVVTSRWNESQVQGWQGLINSVAVAIKDKNEQAKIAREHEQQEKDEVVRLRESDAQYRNQLRDRDVQIERLQGELKLAHVQIESELNRTRVVETLVRNISSNPPPQSSAPPTPPPPSAASASPRRRFLSWLPWIVVSVIVLVVLAVAFWKKTAPLTDLRNQGWAVKKTAGGWDFQFSGDPPEQSLQDLRSISGPLSVTIDSPDHLNSLSGWSALKNLTSLEISGANVVDVSPLRDLKSLTSLDLSNTSVADVSPLKSLRNLTSLNLNDTKVSDLSPLKYLPNLTSLYLNDTPVSDVSALKDMTRLKELYLNGTYVSDLSPVEHLPNLTALSTRDIKVRDAAPPGGPKKPRISK